MLLNTDIQTNYQNVKTFCSTVHHTEVFYIIILIQQMYYFQTCIYLLQF